MAHWTENQIKDHITDQIIKKIMQNRHEPYFYNENLPPISLGVTHGFLDNSGRYSKFQELQNVQREGEANILETSKPVPTLLPTNLD